MASGRGGEGCKEDREMSEPRGTIRGTSGEENENALPTVVGKAPLDNDLQSSWGETRTPDPGIMSAVL
jgi:hypothetical protein